MPSKKKAGNSVKGKKMITVDDEDFEAILAEEVARNVTSMASSIITPEESVAGSPKTDAREATVDPNLEKFVCANCCANAGKKLQKCDKCKQKHYCSSACQKQDWPRHKAWCEKNRESKETISKDDCSYFQSLLKDVLDGKRVPKPPTGTSYYSSEEAAIFGLNSISHLLETDVKMKKKFIGRAELIFKVMQKFDTNFFVQDCGCRAIVKLTDNESIRNELGLAGTCAVLMDALERFRLRDPAFVGNALNAISGLATDNPDNQAKLLDRGVVQLINLVHSTHSGSSYVAQWYLPTLSSTCETPSAKMLAISSNCFERMVEIMEQFPSDHILMKQTLLALMVFCKPSGSMEEAAVMARLKPLRRRISNLFPHFEEIHFQYLFTPCSADFFFDDSDYTAEDKLEMLAYMTGAGGSSVPIESVVRKSKGDF